ncbi:unnamed protein product [Arctogadus glacialis]
MARSAMLNIWQHLIKNVPRSHTERLPWCTGVNIDKQPPSVTLYIGSVLLKFETINTIAHHRRAHHPPTIHRMERAQPAAAVRASQRWPSSCVQSGQGLEQR